MGGQFSYARCPQSPTEMPRKPSSQKWKLWAFICGVFLFVVLFFIFLGLYVKKPSAECDSQLRNHTSSTEGRMTESDALRAQLAAVNQSLANITEHLAPCQEELKHSRENTAVLEGAVRQKEKALKRLDAVNQSLAKTKEDLASCQEELKHSRENITVLEDDIQKKKELLKRRDDVNQSLAKTKEDWASCHEELKHSRENTTVLEDDIQKKKELLKRRDGEKTSLQNQLKNSQETCKRERDRKDKEIQRLNDQLSKRQTSSAVALSGGPIASFLLLIVLGLLCSLL